MQGLEEGKIPLADGEVCTYVRAHLLDIFRKVSTMGDLTFWGAMVFAFICIGLLMWKTLTMKDNGEPYEPPGP